MSVATADILQGAGESTLRLETESCVCPLCRADDPRRTPYEEEPFRVVRCGSCRHWYLFPRLAPSAIEAFYRDGSYFSGNETGYANYAAQEDGLRRTFRRLLRRLAKGDHVGGSVLEVGSGLGYFLDEARPYFSNRTGVELSADAARAAAECSGARVHCDLAELSPAATFDCIVAFHVIEHIYDPVPFVDDLVARLAPGGTIVVAAPDMGSFWRIAMGDRWPSFKFPEHVSFFDAVTLRRLLDRPGLSEARRMPYVHDFPLGEIAAKLGVQMAGPVAGMSIPLPATTVCCIAHRAEAGKS